MIYFYVIVSIVNKSLPTDIFLDWFLSHRPAAKYNPIQILQKQIKSFYKVLYKVKLLTFVKVGYIMDKKRFFSTIILQKPSNGLHTPSRELHGAWDKKILIC